MLDGVENLENLVNGEYLLMIDWFLVKLFLKVYFIIFYRLSGNYVF